MKIDFFEVNKEDEEYIKRNLNLKNHKISYSKGELNDLDKIKDSEAIVVFVNSKVDKIKLDKLKKLKFIATMSTGFDHIDIVECKKRGIKVSNVPNYGVNTVAEYAFGLILSLSRKIPQAVERTKRDDFSLNELEGFDLKGKILGVVGTGHIGQNVIRMAKGFDMKVIAYDKFPDKKLCKDLSFEYVSLSNLLKKSDIISFHVPLLKETHHLLNMKNVKTLKRGSYIINTSRGEIIDTTALLYGLNKGVIAGAGLDVLEGEGDIKEEKQLLKKRMNGGEIKIFIENHSLLKEKNVIITPHSAFYTKEALHRILDTTIENVNGFVKNKVKNSVA